MNRALFMVCLGLIMVAVSACAPGESAMTVSIDCRGDSCQSKPAFLTHWGEIQIISSESSQRWKCSNRSTVGNQGSASDRLPGGSVDCIASWVSGLRAYTVVLESEDANNARTVTLTIFDSDPFPFASMAAGLLAMLSLGLYLDARKTVALRRSQEANFEVIRRNLETSLQGIGAQLMFPDVPLSSMSPYHDTPRERANETTLPPSRLGEQIAQFVRYAEDCFTSLGSQPPDVAAKMRELNILRSEIGKQTTEAKAEERFRQAARILALLALTAVETDTIRSTKRNDMADDGLRRMLEIGGFSLLIPRLLDQFSEKRHHMSNRTIQAETGAKHGYIARVERRGLLGPNGEIIEKATVVLYD